MKLSYSKVFDRYTMSFSDKLAELSYSLYKTLRLRLSSINNNDVVNEIKNLIEWIETIMPK